MRGLAAVPLALALALALASCELDVSGVPSYADASPPACQCADELACTVDRCDPRTGRCEHVPDDALCAVVGEADECVERYCDPERGCRLRSTGAPCDDGDPCTSADRCANGLCSGTPNEGEGCPDFCPSDPKMARGVCGCSVEDRDEDGDRTVDCVDACPEAACPAELSCAFGELLSCRSENGCPVLESSCDPRFSCRSAAPCPAIAFTTLGGLTDHGTVAVASNGDVFTGWTTWSDQAEVADPQAGDALITRFDPDGTRRNSFAWDSGRSDRFAALAVSPDARKLAGALDSAGLLVVAWPARGGSALWRRALDADGPARARDLLYGPGGDVYVIGQVEGALDGQLGIGGADAFVIRLDAESGEARWTQQFGSGGEDEPVAIAGDASGIYVAGVFGRSASDPARGVCFVHEYGADGTLLWQRDLDPFPDEQRPCAVYALAIDAEGKLLISAGTADGGTIVLALDREDPLSSSSAVQTLDAALLFAAGSGDRYGLDRQSRWLRAYDPSGLERWLLDVQLDPSAVVSGAALSGGSGATHLYMVGTSGDPSSGAFLTTVTLR